MGKVILVIDDEPRNVKLVRDLMEANGYTVIEASDGKQGVDTAITEKPDLILMDIMMPVMDGYEAMQLIKTNSATKEIPIIALTSYAMKGDSEKAFESGCDDYMSKPIDIHELLNMVKKYLNEKAT